MKGVRGKPSSDAVWGAIQLDCRWRIVPWLLWRGHQMAWKSPAFASEACLLRSLRHQWLSTATTKYLRMAKPSVPLHLDDKYSSLRKYFWIIIAVRLAAPQSSKAGGAPSGSEDFKSQRITRRCRMRGFNVHPCGLFYSWQRSCWITAICKTCNWTWGWSRDGAAVRSSLRSSFKRLPLILLIADCPLNYYWVSHWGCYGDKTCWFNRPLVFSDMAGLTFHKHLK